MAFDGTAVAGIVKELSEKLMGGRIDKTTQPEPDEIIINIRSKGSNYKLLLTANASAPRLGFTTQSKISPLKAPMFSMVLRKHLSGGRIVDIVQPDFERIVELHIDAMDEMGDRSVKILVIEIMGKHSNIMLLDTNRRVLDAIKHISPAVSSVRTILPGAVYSRPPGKMNPLDVDSLADFKDMIEQGLSIQKSIVQRLNGISPVMASEICARAKIHPEAPVTALSASDIQKLFDTFLSIMQQIKNGHFTFNIYYNEAGKTVDLAAYPLAQYAMHKAEPYDSPSAMLETFYTKRDESYRIGQKTADLRKLVSTHLERCRKKSVMHDKTMEEIKDRDDLKIKGELLTAYLHMIEKGAKVFTAANYYDNNNPLDIPIDPVLTPSENAQKYFKKYNKQKRTHHALQEQMANNNSDIMYLSSVMVSMETITDEADIAEIRAELAEQGFAKRRGIPKNKKANKAAKPLKYTSSDGFDMYVGKNNTQNDYLTLRFANSNDIWLHTKDIPGSHVIIAVSEKGGKEPPETTILEAANLAAFYSRARNSSQVPVDYVAKKHVKKPNGAKPGFVIYDYHKTVYVTPQEPEQNT